MQSTALKDYPFNEEPTDVVSCSNTEIMLDVFDIYEEVILEKTKDMEITNQVLDGKSC